MATPTQCTLYRANVDAGPLERDARAAELRAVGRRSTPGPNGRPCPGQVRPFNPRLVAGTSNPLAGDFSAFTLKLDRDDGDQFLGRPQLQDAPRLHRRPARASAYCPEAAIAAAAANPGRTELVAPSCPASSQVGTTNVAAGPGGAPVPRGRQDVPGGPVQGRAAIGGRGHAGARRALRLRRRRRPGRPARRSADRAGQRRLRHGAEHHRRHPDPDALDPGQHRQARLHDQPDQLLALHGRQPGDRRPGHGHRLLELLPGRQLRAPAVQAEDEDQAARRPQEDTKRPQNPACSIDLWTRAGDANIKSLVGHPPEGLRDRPAPPRQHLLGEGAGRKPSAGAARRSARPETTTPLLDQPLYAARSTRSRAPAACRGWPSSSTARSISLPQGGHEDGQAAAPEDDRARSSPTRRSATST